MNQEQILNELQFKAIRSSGPGGQHANKVSSKVELSFQIAASDGLTERQKKRLLLKLGNKLSKEGVLILQCDESRSQHKNKDLVIKRFFKLLEKSLIVPKARKKSKPTRSSIEKRLKSKKIASLKKINRSKPDY
ncbi:MULTISPECIES: alternative ribosome rescue aminoacyl-tRNA hydrolase ArfB [Maribacter]|uniref:Ribosome-associated protein n=1 Tax=Maribacter dokdonensis TaxID=320912 RepID=A0A1H4KQL0_9FLAO|nr:MULTISPECIES: alternative ribosome rescue aminoacyl-tRNA hydrolase ArfB [Maribacter]PHN95063.1 aminoacyl-tRNA hydrolase [Maribacter sp. 6B07]SDT36080.1 ribosome-associated protein [Maribacter dokdonensis]SEB60824.1 ribosome-associated protein [Maribacter dokdonensis]